MRSLSVAALAMLLLVASCASPTASDDQAATAQISTPTAAPSPTAEAEPDASTGVSSEEGDDGTTELAIDDDATPATADDDEVSANERRTVARDGEPSEEVSIDATRGDIVPDADDGGDTNDGEKDNGDAGDDPKPSATATPSSAASDTTSDPANDRETALAEPSADVAPSPSPTSHPDDQPSPSATARPTPERSGAEFAAATARAEVSVAEWCTGFAPTIQAALQHTIEVQFREPAGFADAMIDLHELFRVASDAAPAEIHSSFTLLVASVDRLEPVMEAADWDLSIIPRDAADGAFESYEKATVAVDTYNATTCDLALGMQLPQDDGFEIPAPPSSSPPAPADEDLVFTDGEIAQFLVLLQQLGLTDPEARCLLDVMLSDAPLALCNISDERLSELFGDVQAPDNDAIPDVYDETEVYDLGEAVPYFPGDEGDVD